MPKYFGSKWALVQQQNAWKTILIKIRYFWDIDLLYLQPSQIREMSPSHLSKQLRRCFFISGIATTAALFAYMCKCKNVLHVMFKLDFTADFSLLSNNLESSEPEQQPFTMSVTWGDFSCHLSFFGYREKAAI